MSKIALTELYPYILPELQGCPKPLVLQKIRQTLIEFCEQTWAWTEELDRQAIVAGVATYDLDIPAGGRIESVKLVEVNGIEMIPYEDYVFPGPAEITLLSTPTATSASSDDGLEVEVVMKPRRDCEQVPTCLFEDHYMTWAHGTLWRLKAMNKRLWTDLPGATYHNTFYWDGIAKAKVDQNRGKLAGPLTAKARFDWAL